MTWIQTSGITTDINTFKIVVCVCVCGGNKMHNKRTCVELKGRGGAGRCRAEMEDTCGFIYSALNLTTQK